MYVSIIFCKLVPSNFQVIEKMEKALDSKLIEKSKQTGDRRPLVNRQKGRRFQCGEITKHKTECAEAMTCFHPM